MSKPFDVASLALEQSALPSKAAAQPPARYARQLAPFLKGPVPLLWLQRAACLAGKAFQVAIALRYRSGVERSATVKLTNVLLRTFGVDRHAKARALRALETAQLIAVSRSVGRNPVVTILEAAS